MGPFEHNPFEWIISPITKHIILLSSGALCYRHAAGIRVKTCLKVVEYARIGMMEYAKSESHSIAIEEKDALLGQQTSTSRALPLIIACCIASFVGLVISSNTIVKVTMAPVTLTFFQFTGTALLTTILSKTWQCQYRPSNERAASCCLVWRGGVLLCTLFIFCNNAYYLSSATYVEICNVAIFPLLLLLDTVLQRDVLLRAQLQRRFVIVAVCLVAVFVALATSSRATEYGSIFAIPSVLIATVYIGDISRQRSETLLLGVPNFLSIDNISYMMRSGSILLFVLVIITERLRMPDEPYFPSQLIALSLANIVCFAIHIVTFQHVLYSCRLSVATVVTVLCHSAAAAIATWWVDPSLSKIEISILLVLVSSGVALVLWD